MKYFKIFLFIITILAGCNIPAPVPLPTPTPIEKTEIPAYLFYSISNITELKQWLQNNYNYIKDEDWSGYKDYPLTPAEFFMSEILIYGVPVQRTPITGDCEDYASLTAYLLWKVLDYDAYIAIIPEFSEPNISHMISFGKGPNGKFVVVNSPWISTQYSSIDEYMQTAYPDKRLGNITPIETYLEKLYSQGHHRYCN